MDKREEEMSNTFIAEVGQKSAIADDSVESLDESTEVKTETNFPDVKIEAPKEEDLPKEDNPVSSTEDDKNNISVETNNIGNTDSVPGYETESNFYEEKPKKKSPIVTILLMILCLAIGVGGTYYYFEVLNKEKDSTIDKKETATKTINESEEVNPEGVFAKKLIERYDYTSTVDNIDTFNELYLNEKTTPSTMNESYARYLIAIDANRSIDKSYFTSEDFSSSQKELFGNSISLTDKTIGETLCTQIKYDSTTKTYTYVEPNGCGGTTDRSMIRKIVKGTKSSNKVEITVAVGLTSQDSGVYKTIDSTNQLTEKLDGVTVDTFDIDKDYTKLNQYKYTFKYDSENDNYYFESIELVK